MDQAFFRENRRKVFEQMQDDAALILFAGESIQRTADELYPFTVSRNFYYLTGLDRERFVLLMTKRDGVLTEKLYIEEVDPENEKWNGKMLTVSEATEISGVDTIAYTPNFQRDLDREMLLNPVSHLYLDLEQRRWQAQLSPTQEFAQTFSAKHPAIQLKNAYPIICELRTIKSPQEVEIIQRAVDITKEGFEAMYRSTHVGVVEYQLEAAFAYALRMRGSKLAYNPIIGTGYNATMMHYLENSKTCEDGEVILADVGAEYQYYKADITRSFPANGKFTDRQREIYDIVLQALVETTEIVRPGIPHIDLDNKTRSILAAGLKRIGLIERDEELTTYYFYNVSHYIGLDTHDVGPYDILKPGMVLTIEPGIYIPQENLGIRLEDNVLVTDTGYDVLSKDLIRTADEIEAFMAKHSN